VLLRRRDGPVVSGLKYGPWRSPETERVARSTPAG
jgi:hypothetical protein